MLFWRKHDKLLIAEKQLPVNGMTGGCFWFVGGLYALKMLV